MHRPKFRTIGKFQGYTIREVDTYINFFMARKKFPDNYINIY